MIFTIAGKELKSLFASPLAWLVLCVVQIIVGYAFLRRLDDFMQMQSQLATLPTAPGATDLVAAPVFGTLAALFLFAVPILAMRMIAEERRNQTLVMLLSAPVSMSEIVLGKFLGLFCFLFFMVALAVLMPLSIGGYTRLDYGMLAGLATGVALLAAGFAAVSLYISCLTAQPVAAAIGAFSALIGMLLAGEVVGESLRARGWDVAASLAQVLSPVKNFEPFGKGMLDTYALACSLLLVAIFLTLAVRQLDAQRLRG
jgi:ABC-2 type transport system permease protein